MNSFNILQEYRALEELLNEVDENGEFVNSEDDIREYIEALADTKANKLNNIEDLKLELKGNIESIKIKTDKLNARKKSIENNINRLIELQELMLQGEKLKTDEYTFSFRKSKSVNIVNENWLLDCYFKTKKEVDKTAINKALKDGYDVAGAELVEKVSLSVR